MTGSIDCVHAQSSLAMPNSWSGCLYIPRGSSLSGAQMALHHPAQAHNKLHWVEQLISGNAAVIKWGSRAQEGVADLDKGRLSRRAIAGCCKNAVCLW